ncbi:putative molybdenum carrier protein [Phaeobacter sp. B1627]|uniref:putative molybdenum carrier protein n=1 Tax=Phaeobacter sp. B1627 TaxID=2583809 RepID=UPI001118A07B|nr:putative molybdenum carrier protein [Phaeobacter sp. B1627]TNJ42489.1 hypothetical protein FGE21_10985 [Phaeobacter sp. B1627]
MKIISGGQTGVDLAALEFAVQRGLRHGGWVPEGRENEDGHISQIYQGLIETHSSEPDERTWLNVGSSDATLIITNGSNSPGTHYTQRVAGELGKPIMHIELSGNGQLQRKQLWQWIGSINPVVLNIAGPRESEAPGVHEKALAFLNEAFPLPSYEPKNYIANIRHWDTIRWIVPFWYLSTTLLVLDGLYSEESALRPLEAALLFAWSIVGLACAYLIQRTMVYHDRQREMLVREFGERALDTMSMVVFGPVHKGWSTATRWFWAITTGVSFAMLYLAWLAFSESTFWEEFQNKIGLDTTGKPPIDEACLSPKNENG